MVGAGGGGDEYHQLDEAQRLLLDAMNAQMQCLLDRNNEEVFGRLELLENQANQNARQNVGGHIPFSHHPFHFSPCIYLSPFLSQHFSLVFMPPNKGIVGEFSCY